MKRSQKLLLPLALVAGAAVPAIAVAADECTVVASTATVTPALADIATADPLREAAVLSFTASEADAELRVKLRQDAVRGRGRGRDERAGVRVVEVGEGAYRVSVRKPEGGDVTFSTERVRSRPGRVTLRLRAVIVDAEGEPVRALRATVQARAVQEICSEEDEAGTMTGEEEVVTGPETTPTGTTAVESAPDTEQRAARDDDDEQDEHRGRGRGHGRGHGRG